MSYSEMHDWSLATPSNALREKMRARVLLSALALMCIGLLSYVLFYSLYVNPCDYEIVREFPSPDKKSAALVILSGCGATTPYATSVALKVDGENFHIDKHNEYLFSVRNKNAVEVVWDSNSALTIFYEHPQLIYRKVVVSRTMPISYREKQ